MNYLTLSVISICSLSFIGSLLYSLKSSLRNFYLRLLILFSFGTILGSITFFLLPESFYHFKNGLAFLGVLIGFGGFYCLDRISLFAVVRKFFNLKHSDSTVELILISASIHSFIDGTVLALSYFVSVQVGIAVSIAIICHEIPHELSKFTILVNSGVKPLKSLILSFSSCSFIVLGVILVHITGDIFKPFFNFLLPITAGNFIYILLYKLTPPLKKEFSLNESQFLKYFSVIFGIFLMLLVSIVFKHNH